MINDKCFMKEWIESFKQIKEHKSIQAPILEKMIHALHLLGVLKMSGLDFVFKGGTSLVLLLQEGNRFSIDIDIVTTASRATLEQVLQNAAADPHFNKVDLDAKRSYKTTGVPKAHYVLEFTSVYDKELGKLLLDILFGQATYPVIIQTALTTKWIETTQPITIATPDINSITGDKLTAFAPNTTGIPYYKGEDSFAMEIAKQMYDLGKLFLLITNVETVYDSFHAFAKEQIGYRMSDEAFKQKELTPEKVLHDIIDTSLMVARREGNKKEPHKTQFADMDRGIRSFGANFLMAGNFRIEDAIVTTARVAHLAAKLLANDKTPITYYAGQDIQSLNIEDPGWNFLNKLKRQPDKSSFYYWHQTLILNGIQQQS